MTTVANWDKLYAEKASRVRCPRCDGVGYTADAGYCGLCKQRGEVWRSESGWIRAIGARIDDSRLW